MTIPEVCASRYRVITENRDSPPLSITGVELTGPLYELAFLASPRQGMQLEYGLHNAIAGQFDTAALQAALSQPQQTASATLLPPRENFNIAAESWKPWNDARVLIGMTVFLTLLLGWGLFRAGRRIDLAAGE